MIGWHPKKKVTLIQIAHWLPVLIVEFLCSLVFIRSHLIPLWMHRLGIFFCHFFFFFIFLLFLFYSFEPLIFISGYCVSLLFFMLKVFGISVRIKLIMRDLMEYEKYQPKHSFKERVSMIDANLTNLTQKYWNFQLRKQYIIKWRNVCNFY